MRSRMELVQEIQLTDWSTAGEQRKLVFVVSTMISLVQSISLFTTGKNRLSIVQVTVEPQLSGLFDYPDIFLWSQFFS